MTTLTELAIEQQRWTHTLPGGCHWSGVIRRGMALRFTALDDHPNLSLLLFNQEEKLERYNMPDTLKAQHTAYLTKGHVLYSDMGRVMASVIGDTVGWHDTIGGISDADSVARQYGEQRYQEARNQMHRNGRDGLLTELGKWGLGRADLVATLNLFSKVAPDEAGALQFVERHAATGAAVDIRFDMHCLVVLSSAPHPLDPSPRYHPADIEMTAWHAGLAGEQDICRLSCPQNGRGFINTERFYTE